MKPVIQSVIIAAMLLTAQPTLFAEEARPGARVAAKWTDGGFYLATVIMAQSGKIEVLYDDGDKGTVGRADVKPVSRNANVNVGDPVLAAWKNAAMFPGIVRAKTAVTVTVRWDDGDEPLEVALDRIALVNHAQADIPVADALPAGTSVAAKWAGDSFYIATITGRDATGKYSVKYGDGTTGTVAPGDVAPVNADREIPVGSRVLACWQSARMYPGTITARRENLYTVKWDDGSAPSGVARDRIAAAPGPQAAAPAAAAPAFAIGTSVAARWGAFSYYIATITGRDENGKYLVNYGDGDKGAVAAADMVPVDANREIPVGAHVLACWHGAAMYPGTVTAKRDNSYTVRWDDGDAPLDVARDRIAILPRAAAVVPGADAGAFAVGSIVAAKWGNSSFYIATITGRDTNGKYLVAYGDGDKGAVAAGDIVRVDAEREIAIGARVLACWAGAAMYQGTVTSRNGNQYTVKWDDGSAPLALPREKIAPLPAR